MKVFKVGDLWRTKFQGKIIKITEVRDTPEERIYEDAIYGMGIMLYTGELTAFTYGFMNKKITPEEYPEYFL